MSSYGIGNLFLDLYVAIPDRAKMSFVLTGAQNWGFAREVAPHIEELVGRVTIQGANLITSTIKGYGGAIYQLYSRSHTIRA